MKDETRIQFLDVTVKGVTKECRCRLGCDS
jgi:hypothetical protein